jgi:hypothetical protein
MNTYRLLNITQGLWTRILSMLLLSLLLSSNSQALPYHVEKGQSLDSLLLGQAFHLDLQLEGFCLADTASSFDAAHLDFHPWPSALRELQDIELVMKGDASYLHIELAAFELGSIVIEWPSLEVNGQPFEPTQPSTSLRILSSFQADSLVQAAGLQAPLLISHALWWWLARAAILVFVALLFFMLWRFLKRPARLEQKRVIAQIPPWDRFLKAMVRLEAAQFIDLGLQDEHYSGLSLALRGYLEDQTHLPCREMTSSELLPALTRLELSPELLGDLSGLLDQNDLIKYARHRSGMQEVLKVEKAYIAWVKAAKAELEAKETQMKSTDENENLAQGDKA